MGSGRHSAVLRSKIVQIVGDSGAGFLGDIARIVEPIGNDTDAAQGVLGSHGVQRYFHTNTVAHAPFGVSNWCIFRNNDILPVLNWI
jgi:hypothetical protein